MSKKILRGCPQCGSYPLMRSHRRGLLDRIRASITGTLPYRCRACQWRGWAHDSWDRRQRYTPEGRLFGRRAEDKTT